MFRENQRHLNQKLLNNYLFEQHDAMRSLSQVIDYFIRTSGGREHTRPLETNDLSLLGLHNPDYDRTIKLGKYPHFIVYNSILIYNCNFS